MEEMVEVRKEVFRHAFAAMRFPQKMPVIRRKKMLLAVKVTVFPPPR